jgi:hypothetical protein
MREDTIRKLDRKEVGGEAADSSRQQHISADNQEKAKGYFPAAPVAETQSMTVLS